MLRGFCPHIMAGLRGLRTYTMKGSLLIGTSLLLLNVCAEAVAQNADYPLQALREGRAGTSHFSVTVGTDGRAIDCVITKSSGSADLDDETSRMMATRGRWLPSLEARRVGNECVSQFRSRGYTIH